MASNIKEYIGLERIRVGAVSYLNAKPLLYGISSYEALQPFVSLSLDYPARLVDQFQNAAIDLALLPVASLLLEPKAQVVSAYGIAADSDVASVCIFSQLPLESVSHLYLDYQSRTSVLLAQILLKEYWKHSVVLLPAHEAYIADIKGTTAGVIIGDRALQNLQHFDYVYDLAAIWKQHTGLPFVFAAWIAHYRPDEKFLRLFDEAQAKGLMMIDAIAKQYAVDYFDLRTYYKKHMLYQLTADAKAGLALFLEKVKMLGLLR